MSVTAEKYFRQRYYEVSGRKDKERYLTLYLKNYFKNRGFR